MARLTSEQGWLVGWVLRGMEIAHLLTAGGEVKRDAIVAWKPRMQVPVRMRDGSYLRMQLDDAEALGLASDFWSPGAHLREVWYFPQTGRLVLQVACTFSGVYYAEAAPHHAFNLYQYAARRSDNRERAREVLLSLIPEEKALGEESDETPKD